MFCQFSHTSTEAKKNTRNYWRVCDTAHNQEQFREQVRMAVVFEKKSERLNGKEEFILPFARALRSSNSVISLVLGQINENHYYAGGSKKRFSKTN